MTSILAPATKQALAVGDSVKILVGGHAGECGQIRHTSENGHTIYTSMGNTLYNYRDDQLMKIGAHSTGNVLQPSPTFASWRG